ncbi:MAG TPA: YCF48-related protein [Chitinophagales bacterium]|nr:YCF48-related protein [Chitinophagales bacterium]
MNKLYALLLIASFVLNGANAQTWNVQTSGTTQNLFSLSFPSSTVGWAVGASGTARATNSAGQSWSTQSAATLTWYGSSFVSTSQGWICGSGGGIMTSNGTTWSSAVSNTTSNLYDIQMVSSSTGWIVGAAGTIRRTTGSGWIGQSSGTQNDLRAVYFRNVNLGWVAGAGGKILKTTNSGTNWTSLTTGTTQDLFGVYFANDTQGWAVGASGTIRATSNGGTTWSAQTSGTTQTLRSVYFVSATQGWAVGDNGIILKTTNGGATWTSEASGTTQALNAVYMVSATSGWIAGNSGTILVYCNPPAQPGNITGSATGCIGASQTYSVSAVSGATSYTWTLPTGWTGTSTTNSITTTVGNTSGTISVRANIGGCSSAARTINVTTNAVPAQPGIITGNASPCTGSSQTYSISSVSGATSYTWTLPVGWTGSSTINSIAVTAGNSGGTITVTANNGSCSSTPQTRNLTVSSIPAQPGTITGLTSVCNGNSLTYGITAVAGATSYTWTLPSGWSGTSTSNAIGVTSGSSSGNIAVSAVNTCGSSAPRTLAVTTNQTPAQPGAITGNTTVCYNTSNTFSVATVPGATSYTWTIPSGWTGTSTTNSITVTAGTVGGTISVKANNGSCSSAAQTLAVSVITAPLNGPGSITGATQVCSGSAQTYSVPGIASATSYTWTLPSGWTGSSTTTSINVTTSSSAGNVTVVAVNSCGTSQASSLPVTVSGTVTPTIAINAATNPLCAGAQATFTSSITNGGNAPAYQWKNNGSNITGATSSTYSSSTLANGDVISCVLTSNSGCANPTTATSNNVTVTLTPNVTPGVSISTTNSSICSGTSVTFTASPTNGGAAPVYQWKVNGNNEGAGSNTYTSSTLANNDVVSCVLTSNAACASPVTAASNSVTMTVASPVAPSISISATQTTICSGNSVTFTAVPANGGNAPAYQWKLNGTNIGGATNATYSSSSLNDNDQISCELTSSASCISSGNATSNTVTIAVSSTVTPSVIVTTSADSVCPGESVTFTAAGTNGGTTPSYQWKKNGTDINAATSSSYTTSTVLSSDVFTCVLTSSVGCASPTTAVSNSKSVYIKPTFTPTVSITPSSNSICENGNVNFTSTVSGEGSAPTYQWKVNSVDVSGEVGAAFSSATLAIGDEVTLQLTSSDACAVPSVVESAPAALTINPLVTPSVSISASQTVICSGASVVFTATVAHGGTSPGYQWKLNGNNITGETNSTYTSTSLVDGDEVSCAISSNATCAAVSGATSAGIALTENSTVTASVTIATASTNLCDGQQVVFAATPANGGAAPVYQWLKNGSTISGATLPTYTEISPANNDMFKCEMISNASCVQQPTVLSNELQLTVNVLPDVTVSQSANTLTVPTAATYQWFDCTSSADISGANSATYTATANGNYAVRVSNSAGCIDTSQCVNVTGVGIIEAVGAGIQVMPNPFQHYITINLLDNVSQQGVVELYDVTGRLVVQNTLTTVPYQLDVMQAKQGAYVLRITTGGYVWVKRLVKE